MTTGSDAITITIPSPALLLKALDSGARNSLSQPERELVAAAAGAALEMDALGIVPLSDAARSMAGELV
jgi:hypothetical protein